MKKYVNIEKDKISKHQNDGIICMIFLVNQGKTWKQERAGGFLWSPKLNAVGQKNPGYELLNHVQKGDNILHSKDGMLAAISIAKKDCYYAIQSEAVRKNSGPYNWADEEYRIDTTHFDFSTPVATSHFVPWEKLHYHEDSSLRSMAN